MSLEKKNILIDAHLADIIWYFIEFISILPLVLIRFYLPLSRWQIVIAERFVIDWVVTLAFATSNELLINEILQRLFFNFIPKASLLIYIDADYDAILSRGRVDESIDFIQFQRKFYSELARKFDAIVIDTSNKTKAVVNQSILQYVTNISH